MLLLALAVAPATADVTFTTGEFKTTCTEPAEPAAAFCHGYVQAVMDFAHASKSACVPDDATSPEVLEAIEALTFDKIGTQGFPETQRALMMTLAVVNNLFPCDG